MLQLILHLVGDYLLQSTWMAVNKTERTLPCLCHCLLYTLPFGLLTQSWVALGIIFGSHFLIDRFKLARYLVWAKNWLSPVGFYRWSCCRLTGYFDAEVARPRESSFDPDVLDEEDALVLEQVNLSKDAAPVWLRVWLCIIADNTLHLLCNYAALSVVSS